MRHQGPGSGWRCRFHRRGQNAQTAGGRVEVVCPRRKERHRRSQSHALFRHTGDATWGTVAARLQQWNGGSFSLSLSLSDSLPWTCVCTEKAPPLEWANHNACARLAFVCLHKQWYIRAVSAAHSVHVVGLDAPIPFPPPPPHSLKGTLLDNSEFLLTLRKRINSSVSGRQQFTVTRIGTVRSHTHNFRSKLDNPTIGPTSSQGTTVGWHGEGFH